MQLKCMIVYRFATIHRPLSTKPTAAATPPTTSTTTASATKTSNKKSRNAASASQSTPAPAASLTSAAPSAPAAHESEDEFHLVNLSEEEPDLRGLFEGLSDDDLGM